MVCFCAKTLITKAMKVSFSWRAVISYSVPPCFFIIFSPSNVISDYDVVKSHMEKTAITWDQCRSAIMWVSERQRLVCAASQCDRRGTSLKSGLSFLSNSLNSQQPKLKVHWTISQGGSVNKGRVFDWWLGFMCVWLPRVTLHVHVTSSSTTHCYWCAAANQVRAGTILILD